MKNFTVFIGCLLIMIATGLWLTDCHSNPHAPSPATKEKVSHGPALGSKGNGPSYDKSADTTLTRLIKETLPEFKQFAFHDVISGKTIAYNLFVPQPMHKKNEVDSALPLVLFMADASTPGRGVTAPLTQGYGALVWATKEWQAKHPCFVLVPQFSGVAVNDDFQHTPEVGAVIRLVDFIANRYPVDLNRIYTTGQSMGGMISMYYLITYPNVFAAAMPVDCHWDLDKFGQLVKHPFVYVTAGGSDKSQKGVKAVISCAKAAGIKYETAEFSARLPQAEQDSIAARMLAKGAKINIITFSPGTVIPAGIKGNEHMYSFDHAYRLLPAREWLFNCHK